VQIYAAIIIIIIFAFTVSSYQRIRDFLTMRYINSLLLYFTLLTLPVLSYRVSS